MSVDTNRAWVYLDLGEIFEADADGGPDFDKPVATLAEYSDEVGNLVAAAPALRLALKALVNNIVEFGQLTHGELIDSAIAAIDAAEAQP